MEGPILPENFNTGLPMSTETEQSSYPLDLWQDAEIHTNNMEPERTYGYRNVALNRFVGMDTSELTDEKNTKEGKPLTAMDAFSQFERTLYSANLGKDKLESIEKTPQQKEICEMIIRELPRFLEEFGLETPALIPESAVQIMDMSHLDQIERERSKRASAFWSPSQQRIYFNGDTVGDLSNLGFARKVAHELVHAQSFNSLESHKDMTEKDDTHRTVRKRRGGLVNYVHEKDVDDKDIGIDYFAELDEAVTESLAQHFIYAYLNKIPHIEDDIKSTNLKLQKVYHEEKAKKANTHISVEDNVTGLRFGDEESQDTQQIVLNSGSYWKEIEQFKRATKFAAKKAEEYQEEFGKTNVISVQPILHNLLMSIHSDADVTKLMARTYFTGNQLDFARLATFVTKKDFREIGKQTSLVKKRYPESFK